MKRQRYSIDDLPRFSPWPARLLGIESWQVRSKTPEEILREYDQDKWGALLQRIRESAIPVTLDEVDNWDMGVPFESLTWVRGSLRLMTLLQANRQYLRIVRQTITSLLPVTAVAELGCGYGKVVLRLPKNEEFAGVPFFAAEYTQSGITATRELSAGEGLSVGVGWCDFTHPDLTDIPVPEGALLFTSFATPCIPELPGSFVESLIARKPKVVVHFEPCWEHCDTTSMLGLMRRRYLEVNDYNRNLMTLLWKFRDAGRIIIDREEPAVFGENPLLSASIIVWRPVE